MPFKRVRFPVPYAQSVMDKIKAGEDVVGDTRPVIWPTTYPCWCSGSGDLYDIWVAYAPMEGTEDYIRKYWPEFGGLFDFEQERETIEDSGRFPIDREVYDEHGIAKLEPRSYGEIVQSQEPGTEEHHKLLEESGFIERNPPKGVQVVGDTVLIGTQTDPKEAAVSLYEALHGTLPPGLAD